MKNYVVVGDDHRLYFLPLYRGHFFFKLVELNKTASSWSDDSVGQCIRRLYKGIHNNDVSGYHLCSLLSNMSSTTVVSAPGKVLIAGGYLVLDPAYSGVVVSASSRFYAVVQSGSSSPPTPPIIRVQSPQFLDATWSYSVSLDESRHVVEPTQEKYVVCRMRWSFSLLIFEYSSSSNKFVHLALQHTIALAVEVNGVNTIREQLAEGLCITIVGDNDFYSQRTTVCSSRLYLVNWRPNTHGVAGATSPSTDNRVAGEHPPLQPYRRYPLRSPQDRPRVLRRTDHLAHLGTSRTSLCYPTIGLITIIRWCYNSRKTPSAQPRSVRALRRTRQSRERVRRLIRCLWQSSLHSFRSFGHPRFDGWNFGKLAKMPWKWFMNSELLHPPFPSLIAKFISDSITFQCCVEPPNWEL